MENKMGELEKIARYIELTGHKKVVNKARYGMGLQEYTELVDMAMEKPFEVVQLVFDYGFAKGFRAGKAFMTKQTAAGTQDGCIKLGKSVAKT